MSSSAQGPRLSAHQSASIEAWIAQRACGVDGVYESVERSKLSKEGTALTQERGKLEMQLSGRPSLVKRRIKETVPSQLPPHFTSRDAEGTVLRSLDNYLLCDAEG